jgi:hypothetical protein
MSDTRELLLTYQGMNGFDGLCHVRVYEQPGQLPTVIAGALEDNPGTSITNAIEMVAAAVQRSQFQDGREFRLIEHYPDTIDRRGTPTYALIHFEHRAIHERPEDPRNHAGQIVVLSDDSTEEPAVAHGEEIEGDFRNPRWQPIHDIEKLLGRKIPTWPPGTYTAEAVGDEQGEQLRLRLAAQARRRSTEIIDAVEGDIEP